MVADDAPGPEQRQAKQIAAPGFGSVRGCVRPPNGGQRCQEYESDRVAQQRRRQRLELGRAARTSSFDFDLRTAVSTVEQMYARS